MSNIEKEQEFLQKTVNDFWVNINKKEDMLEKQQKERRIINFRVTKNNAPLDPSLYTWDDKTWTFSTKEEDLLLDFTNEYGITFKTGSNCSFKTGSGCTFRTGKNCTFDTRYGCSFKTEFNCTFKTGAFCTFDTGSYCTFNTGYDCTFKVGSGSIFYTWENCFATRYDVKGVMEIPAGIKIKLNDHEVAGYTTL
jgi:hypothetical protein